MDLAHPPCGCRSFESTLRMTLFGDGAVRVGESPLVPRPDDDFVVGDVVDADDVGGLGAELDAVLVPRLEGERDAPAGGAGAVGRMAVDAVLAGHHANRLVAVIDGLPAGDGRAVQLNDGDAGGGVDDGGVGGGVGGVVEARAAGAAGEGGADHEHRKRDVGGVLHCLVLEYGRGYCSTVPLVSSRR